MPDIAEPGPAVPEQRRGADPVRQVLGVFTRTGGFYARSWGSYLDREPDPLPVARPTLALAAQAFRDEIVLTGFRMLGSAPDATTLARIDREVSAALRFYDQQGWLARPEEFFTAPPPLKYLGIKPAKNMGRNYERVFFDSGYTPHTGEPGRDRWLSYTGNNREYGLMLRHRRPRPWLVCIHGAQMGRAALDPLLFHAWHLHHDLGLNVMLPVLPLHGPRARGRPKGATFPSADVLDEVHGVAQSVWDIRRLLSWIRSQQPEAPIGLNGISLGGFITSLVASLDDALSCAILGVPAVNLVELVDRHAGQHNPMRHTMQLAKPIGQMISPFALDCRVPMRGRFIYAGVADRLVHPRDQVARLWDHWGRPEIHWYQGGHTGFFRSQPVQRFVDGALVHAGLVEPDRLKRRR